MRRAGSSSKRSSTAAARWAAELAPRPRHGRQSVASSALQARIELRLLGQIGDARCDGCRKRSPRIQLDQPGQRLEQGGLAGAVAADQADPISLADRQR